MWLAIRFHEDDEAFDKWWVDVRAKYDAGAFTTPSPASTDLEFPGNDQEGIPFEETAPDLPLIETEQEQAFTTPKDVWGEPPVDRSLTPTVVEPEKVVTEVSPQPPALPTEAEFEASLKKRFSKDRFDHAIDTLDRYGEAEGLRRLKADDPEIAAQLEQQRNREKLEESER